MGSSLAAERKSHAWVSQPQAAEHCTMQNLSRMEAEFGGGVESGQLSLPKSGYRLLPTSKETSSTVMSPWGVRGTSECFPSSKQ